MDAVELCAGGPRLSPIVAGAWRMGDWDRDAAQRLRWIEQCLELGVPSFDHADLLIHRPDPLLDANEVAEAIAGLQAASQVRAFGVSNYSPAQLELLNKRFALVTNQIECLPLHLVPLVDGTLDQCQGLRVTGRVGVDRALERLDRA